jgi:hypothetical protein
MTVSRWQRWAAGYSGGFGKVGVAHGRDCSISDPAGGVAGGWWQYAGKSFTLDKSSAFFAATCVYNLFPACLESAEQIDPFSALNLQRPDGVLQGLFSFGFRGVIRGYAAGIVMVDNLESGSPGPQCFLFVVLV